MLRKSFKTILIVPAVGEPGNKDFAGGRSLEKLHGENRPHWNLDGQRPLGWRPQISVAANIR